MYYNNYQLLLLSNNVTLAGVTPASITFDPSGVSTSEFAYTLVYDFGDNTQQTVTYTKYPKYSGKQNIDPLFFPVTHKYDTAGTYTVSISVFQIDSDTPQIVTANIELIASPAFNFNIIKSSLINTKNDVLFVLESEYPRLVAPVIASWDKKILPEPVTKAIQPTPEPTTPVPTPTPVPEDAFIVIPGTKYPKYHTLLARYKLVVDPFDKVVLNYDSNHIPDRFTILNPEGDVITTSGWVGDFNTYDAELASIGQDGVVNSGVGSISFTNTNFYDFVYIKIESLNEESYYNFIADLIQSTVLVTDSYEYLITDDGNCIAVY